MIGNDHLRHGGHTHGVHASTQQEAQISWGFKSGAGKANIDPFIKSDPKIAGNFPS